MKRTLKRELKGLEIAEREAIGPIATGRRSPRVTAGASRPGVSISSAPGTSLTGRCLLASF